MQEMVRDDTSSQRKIKLGTDGEDMLLLLLGVIKVLVCHRIALLGCSHTNHSGRFYWFRQLLLISFNPSNNF